MKKLKSTLQQKKTKKNPSEAGRKEFKEMHMRAIWESLERMIISVLVYIAELVMD